MSTAIRYVEWQEGLHWQIDGEIERPLLLSHIDIVYLNCRNVVIKVAATLAHPADIGVEFHP